MPTRSIYSIFFLSGMSGLLYQVVWVRGFGQIFGNTVYSASLVIAVFMCGLGLGSYFVGRWIDRKGGHNHQLALAAYGISEILIALLAAAVGFILPLLSPWAAALTSYSQDSNGWFEPSLGSMWLRGLVATVLLLPVTTLMGGTLTLLARYLLVSNLKEAGWRMGLLYGFNTLGAALGAFLSDFAMIPTFGILATQGLAVVFNALAALLALRLARSQIRSAGPAKAAASPAPHSDDSTASRTMVVASSQITNATMWTALAIFLSGFCAMGIELLWFRQLHIALGGFRPIFSLLLTIILLGMWLGSMVGGWSAKRWDRPALIYLLSQALLVITILLLLAWVRPVRSDIPMAAESYQFSWGARLSVQWSLMKELLLLAGMPAFLMGFAYPLANAHIQKNTGSIGSRAGLLYLVNTLGAVSGSIVTGFFLLPSLSTQGSVTVLALIGTGSVIALYWADFYGHDRTSGKTGRLGYFAIGASALGLAAAFLLWVKVPDEQFTHYGIAPQEKVLEVSQGVNELVVVTELPSGARRLKTNGHNMSGNDANAQRYMAAFVHVPLAHLANPTDVLVICFGVGTTLHAAALHHSLKNIEVADLSREVLEHAKFFGATNFDVLHDPRVKVFVNDGRQHLRMRPETTYDLITLEPPPLGFAGVSSLYSSDFYKLARSRLKPGGFMTQWLPGYQMPEEAVKSIIHSFVHVFPNAIMISGFGKELILMGSAEDVAFTISPEQLKAFFAAEPDVAKNLERLGFQTVTKFIGSFVAGSQVLYEATKNVLPVTDDFPLMEYAAPPVNCSTSRFPKQAIAVGGVVQWCPTCFLNGQPNPAVADLPNYLGRAEREYLSDKFLDSATCR